MIDPTFERTLKHMNPESSADYNAQIEASDFGERPLADRFFIFTRHDLKILYLTRKVAVLTIPRDGYRQLFETDVMDDFKDELEELKDQALITIYDEAIRRTLRGMFYADTVAPWPGGRSAWVDAKTSREGFRRRPIEISAFRATVPPR